jgi:bacteriocin biosynthesis cyclodehydratase domain-containing protein
MHPLPRRPVLRPGLRVLRRGPAELQIGLDPRRAVALADSDAVRRTLAVLDVAGPADDADLDVLTVLHGLGVLEEHGAPRSTGKGRVEVRSFGMHPLPDLALVLDEAGLEVDEPFRSPDAGAVGLLAGVGEPSRDLLDDWIRDGLPHLVLRFSEGEAVVGPFVEPGVTACLRCIDAHHTDTDARWPLLVAQQAAYAERPRADGIPEPVDGPLLRVATAWAVADIASHLRGERPATWSSTLRLPPALADSDSTSWLRHPECGCSWNQVHEVRSTG